MNTRFLTAAACAGLCAAVSSGAAPAGASRPVTVDDLMRLRAIVDVRISPDGERVAYVASTPSLPKNEHEAELFLISAGGGRPTRVGETVRIFNLPVPRPQLRWSPDGTMLSVLGFAGTRPQVFALPVAGGPSKSLTAAPEGVSAYEWSPDGTRLAYLTRDSMSVDEERQRQDRSFVIRADAPDRPTRLMVQSLESTAAPVTLTPPMHYVDAFSWSPDGREIAYSAAPRSGFSAPYETRVYAVAAQGGAPRTIVDRKGINQGPVFSPDGGQIAFISTNGRTDIMSSRSLTVVPSPG